MRMSKRLAAVLAAGALSFAGSAAGPGDNPNGAPPQADNACPGMNEAQGDEGGEGQTDGTPAADVLAEVASYLDDENSDCQGDGSASGDNGRNQDG